MSAKALAWVFANSKSRLGDRLVLLAIADAADDRFKSSAPLATISGKAQVHERHARRSLRRLQDMGELEVVEKAGPNGTNVYEIRAKTE